MNKRDYFAAQAMQAIIAKLPLVLKYEGNEEGDDLDVEFIMRAVANGAYLYADAMMTKREERNW